MLEYIMIDILGYEVRQTCINIIYTLTDLLKDAAVKSVYDVDNHKYLKQDYKEV